MMINPVPALGKLKELGHSGKDPVQPWGSLTIRNAVPASWLPDPQRASTRERQTLKEKLLYKPKEMVYMYKGLSPFDPRSSYHHRYHHSPQWTGRAGHSPRPYETTWWALLDWYSGHDCPYINERRLSGRDNREVNNWPLRRAEEQAENTHSKYKLFPSLYSPLYESLINTSEALRSCLNIHIRGIRHRDAEI